MRSRVAVVALWLAPVGVLLSALPGPAAQAHTDRSVEPRLSVRTSMSAVVSGTTVTMSGNSRGAVRGAVRLLEAAGSSWVPVDVVRPGRHGYTFRLTPTVGTHTYRTSQHAAGGRVVTSTPIVVRVEADAASPELMAARARILADTNAYRAQAGLAPLVETAAADDVAQHWGEQMADSGDFEHNPAYADQMPAGWRRVGENIALGYPPESVSAAWYASPGHRANMLGDYTVIGIGYAVDAAGHSYLTQDFGAY